MLPPEPAHATLDRLERHMAAAWPAPESSTAGGWVLRSTGGITQRANSIWPMHGVADAGAGDTSVRDTTAGLRLAENWYAARRQPVIFQLTRRPENADLENFLDTRGYSVQSETIIMTAAVQSDASAPSTSAPSAGVTVSCADAPDEEWFDTWWSVDGRGGPAGKRLGHGIISAVPSIYASARNSAGEVVGTGRLTILQGWGGVYCMATHPDFRRQGVAAANVQALGKAASAAGAERLWLVVTAANTGARELYAAAGFVERARYHYRQAPLRRAPGAC